MKARGRCPICRAWVEVEFDARTQDPRDVAPTHDPDCQTKHVEGKARRAAAPTSTLDLWEP